MAQVIEIGSKVNFYRYSGLGKAVVEDEVKALSGDMVELEIDTTRYDTLPDKIITPRQNLIDE